MTDVFISYSRKDIAFARLLHEALVENELETWIDWQDIPPSADWLAEVYEAIEGADAFLFIISETSLASEICGLEMAHAAKHNKRLIPIVIKDIEAEKVPKELSVLNWIFFDEAGEKFAEAMDDLVTAITVDQAWVKGHTRFENRALDWERKERDRGLLLRGADLSEAETWLSGSADKDPGPTALQTEYILKSREDATRRQRMTLMGVGAALIVAIGLGILAWTQRNVAVSEGNARATAQAQAEEQRDIADEQRIVAEARQLAALSQAYVETDLDLAILLSIEGHKRDPNYLTQGSLLAVLQENPYTLRQFHLLLRVADLEFHPDGGFFATASVANIQFWDPVNSVQIFEPIIGHSRLIHDIAINNNGSILASTSEDGTLKLWDLENDRQLIATLLENDSLSAAMHLAFSPDDKILAAATENKQVWVWDTQTLEVVSLQAGPLEFEELINGLVINNYNQIILFFSETVELWDYQSGQRIAQFDGDSIDEIAFNASKELLAGFDKDEPRLYIWNSETGELIKKIRFNSLTYDYSSSKIKIHPNGKWLFLITDDVIQYLDWQDPDKINTLQTLPKTNYANSQNILEFNPNGRSIIFGGTEGIVYLRSVYGIDQENDPFYGYKGAGYGLSLSPDEEVLAATGLDENDQPIINLWDFPDLNFIGSISLGQDDTQFPLFLKYRTIFLPDGKLVFSGMDKQIDFFDPGTLSKISKQFLNEEVVHSIALSPNGKFLAALNSYKGELQIWDIESEELLGELVLNEENKLGMWSFNCVAFSPDNETLAAGVGKGLITFWDLETLEIIGDPIIAHDVSTVSLEYSHDGKTLASSDNQGKVLLWDTETRFSIGVPMINGSSSVNKILFNQDDSVIFTGNDVGEISLWDVQTQQPIGLPLTATNARQLAADLPNFDAFYGRGGHEGSITNMVLSSDDRYLITMDNEGTMRIWDFDIESWYEKACFKAGRNLSQNEWGLYFPNEPYKATCPQFAETSDQIEMDSSAYTTRTREIDNMVQVFVPSGEFEFGSRTWTDDGGPFQILNLDSFWIDQTEVSNAQYQLCVTSGSCTPPASNSSSTRISNYYGYEIYANYPVVFVSFSQAEDYCRWVGGRIPIETEWEKAARGTTGDDYPWGNSPPTSNLVNFHFMKPDTTAVGSYPAGSSPYGALDIVGNVREWTYDYNQDGDSELPLRLRGGAYNTSYVYTWMVESSFDGYYWNDLGFRCVSDD